MSRRRVAIIGAGVCGLTSVKACLEEGLEPVCFERHDDIGGVWYYTDQVRPEQGSSVYNSLITNVSKESSCFSDFPYPRDYPAYMSCHQLHRYLTQYAETFGLRKYARLNTKVTEVRKAEDHVTSGRWIVSSVSMTAEGSFKEEEYDALMVCSGPFSKSFTPNFPGLDHYSGLTIHSREYKRAGNSAGDVAVDVSHVASKLYLSMRDGTWIYPRLSHGGTPIDMLGSRGFLPYPAALNTHRRRQTLAEHVNQTNYGLETDKDMYEHVMVNDELRFCLINGKVLLRPGVTKFTRTGALLADGTMLENIDAVVFATGYKEANVSYLDDSILAKDPTKLDLYKLVFPANMPHPSMAVIGFFHVRGSIPPVAEVQARWAARVFSGQAKLPDRQTMLARVRRDREERLRILGKHMRNKLPKIGVIPYRDEIAREIGAMPTFWNLFLKDPMLAFRVYSQPPLPAHYRLVGPHPWPKAPEYTKEAVANTFYSLRHAGKASTSANKMAAVSSISVVFIFVALMAIVLRFVM
ncbi:PREDICTED: dimethylaniline monooxygenase [N-oxide-forming] 2-like [Branchiostoma belcheri]|uniref:Flavin-containing monooxygenase n=1 Tax=Branchiostoma belcheri TaxID=7741 RepID=A0A6P4YG79_BRABE|nr:PREDICTED: dimethylaniline monooxygenase [N-oxide-forming] 2-like [Branchiostoma belcheri]